MNYDIAVLYKVLSRKHEFRENWISDSHSLLQDRNEFLPYFPYFLSDLDEMRCRCSYLMFLSIRECLYDGLSANQTYGHK